MKWWQDAFKLSETYGTPVLLRPTTRVCHGCATMEVSEAKQRHTPEGFVRNSRWVIFPQLSYQSHLKIEERNPALGEQFSTYRFNHVTGGGRLGIAAGGVSWAYLTEALGDTDVKLFKVSTPHPFPETLALEFLNGLDEVLVIEGARPRHRAGAPSPLRDPPSACHDPRQTHRRCPEGW